MKIAKVFHSDHGVSQETMMSAFQGQTGFVLRTLELPVGHADLINKLYGPACGDGSMSEESYIRVRDASDAYRPETPFVKRPPRTTRLLTVIGVVEGESVTVFTAYGGPAAQRVPNDPSLTPNTPEHDAAVAFWKDHALSDA